MLQASQNKRRLSAISDNKLERSFSEERGEKLTSEGPKPRVYTISGERPMLSDHKSDSMELVVMKTGQDERHHHHHSHHHHHPLQNSGSAHNITRPCKSWSGSRQNSKECPNCSKLSVPAQHSFDLEQHQSNESGWRKKKLERMYSVDRVSGECQGLLTLCHCCNHERGYPFPSYPNKMQVFNLVVHYDGSVAFYMGV